jgi:multiple sugar transport system ATP-binding protein
VAGFIGSPAMNFVNVTATEIGSAIWIANPGLQIKVPNAWAHRLHGYLGQEVTLGVRPEDLRLASGGDANELSFDSVVEVVEQLGSETLLDVKVGPCAMVAALPPTVGVKIRDQMRLALNPAQLHFFDTKTGAAI